MGAVDPFTYDRPPGAGPEDDEAGSAAALAPVHGHQLFALAEAAGLVGVLARLALGVDLLPFGRRDGVLLGLALGGPLGADPLAFGLALGVTVREFGVLAGGLRLKLGQHGLLGFG